jgi:hypothetical protein
LGGPLFLGEREGGVPLFRPMINICFLKRLFYTKKQLYKVGGKKVGTIKKIKNSEENK